MILLSTIMLPFAVTMIPQFVAFTRMGWVDTWLPLIVPSLFGNIGMIFFLKQFMVGIPNELFDAARVDGCTPFKMFYKIMFPIVKPAVAVQFILWFMGSWNDFLGPIIYINTPEKLPVQAVIATLKSYYVSGTDFALIMTASVIALMPILIIFIVFNRYFVDTLALSGIKG
jgi:multiple sugar transport system permease protein